MFDLSGESIGRGRGRRSGAEKVGAEVCMYLSDIASCNLGAMWLSGEKLVLKMTASFDFRGEGMLVSSRLRFFLVFNPAGESSW